jgi:S1-C subfamily serine protease
VRLPAKFTESLGQETGLLLMAVEADSPADQAGLLLGDIIVALAGSPVRQHDDLLAAHSGDRVGQAVAVQVIRGGQLAEVAVTIGEWQ